MKYLLLILTLSFLSSCIFEGEQQDLSHIEKNQSLFQTKQDSIQTKVDSLSGLSTKVDTVILHDSLVVKDTISSLDTVFEISKDTLVVYDSMVVKDTLVVKDTVIYKDTLVVKDTVIYKDTLVVTSNINNSSTLKDTIYANNKSFSYYGRFDFTDPKNPRFNWPGNYIETNFNGKSLSILLTGDDVYVDVFIDGIKVTNVKNLTYTGDATIKVVKDVNEYFITNSLSDTIHTLKINKRSETFSGFMIFNGLLLDKSKSIVTPKKSMGPKIEVIGDSYSVGYGNLSLSKTNNYTQDISGRKCSSDELKAYTNTHEAYGPLAAMLLDGEYYINAVSGLGMVRNYGGSTSSYSLPYYYHNIIIKQSSSLAWDFSVWKPDVVVLFLGVNDFSTQLKENEIYTDEEDLISKFKLKYIMFINELRLHYPGVSIVCVGTKIGVSDKLVYTVQELIKKENDDGANDLSFFYFEHITKYGCDWHPDKMTHRKNGNSLAVHIDSLLKIK